LKQVRILKVNTQGGEAKDGGGMNSVIKKYYELQIKTLQNVPRDVDKLESLLKTKRRQKDEAVHIEDTQRLVTEEIEMLKVVLRLVRCNRRAANNNSPKAQKPQ
jgi:hypothetical protein